MKTLKSIFFALTLVTGLFVINFSADAQSMRGSVMSSTTVESIEVEIESLEEGMNKVGFNPATGSTLIAYFSKGEIKGFKIRQRSGRVIKLGTLVTPGTAAGPQPPNPGCPDGWDAELICYTHKVYNVTVCWLRCTPTTITIGLNPGW